MSKFEEEKSEAKQAMKRAQEAMEKAQEAMEKAQEKYDAAEKELKDWKTANPGFSRNSEDYKELKGDLQRAFENLQSSRKLYNDLINQQQGIYLIILV